MTIKKTVSSTSVGRTQDLGRVSSAVQFAQLGVRERQLVERHWQMTKASPGCQVYQSGTAIIMCWKEPGPGPIFNFAQLPLDPCIKGNSDDWEVDICKAEDRCLYLVSQNEAALKLLLYRHRRVALVPQPA